MGKSVEEETAGGCAPRTRSPARRWTHFPCHGTVCSRERVWITAARLSVMGLRERSKSPGKCTVGLHHKVQNRPQIHRLGR